MATPAEREAAAALAIAKERAGGGTPDTYWEGGGGYFYESLPGPNGGIQVTRPDGKVLTLGWDHPLVADILAEQGTRSAAFGRRAPAQETFSAKERFGPDVANELYSKTAPPPAEIPSTPGETFSAKERYGADVANEMSQTVHKDAQARAARPTREAAVESAMEATGKQAPYWQARDLPRAEFAYSGALPIPGDPEGRTLADVFSEPGVFVPPDAPGWDRTAWTGPTTNRELEDAIRMGRVEQLGTAEGRPVWTYEGRVNPRIGAEEAAEMARIQAARKEGPAEPALVKRTYAAKAKPPTKAPPRSARSGTKDALKN